MKITRLRAENVHGYLPIDVEFYEDLTFITGLNGSGKTSALRLLMALLTPNLDELGSIEFSLACVVIREGDADVVVKATKTPEAVTLSISSFPQPLVITSSELEVYMDVRRREDSRSPIIEKYQQDPIFQRIKAIATPMFLGLDRRFFAPGVVPEDLGDARRREYLARRYWPEDPGSRGTGSRGTGIAALVEVNYLVVTKMQEVRASQEELDDRLRANFIKKAFEYKPGDILGSEKRELPSRQEVEKYRQQLSNIAIAAEGLRIPIPDIQSAVTGFLERMSQVVEEIEKQSLRFKSNRRTSRKDRRGGPFVIPQHTFLEWIVNKPQADRVLEHLRLLDEYIERRKALRDPIERFVSLVNSFLKQTNKVISVAQTGQVMVRIAEKDEVRTISALSSGERQLLVMLAHLSLNPDLAGSGVFIVDEPELSLHISWQERFVDAIREANPKVQLILATHSPAIILDREEACRTLSEVTYA